jgi:hypothetical protein
MKLVDLFIESIFWGFGIFSILLLLIKPFPSKSRKDFYSQIDHTACMMISYAGFALTISWLFNLWELFFVNQCDRFNIAYHIVGPYWTIYWIQPLFFIFISQVVWFEKVRSNQLLRLLIGIVLIVFSVATFERMVIFIVSFNYDFTLRNWTSSVYSIVTMYLYRIAIFSAVLFFVHYIRTRLLSSS